MAYNSYGFKNLLDFYKQIILSLFLNDVAKPLNCVYSSIKKAQKVNGVTLSSDMKLTVKSQEAFGMNN